MAEKKDKWQLIEHAGWLQNFVPIGIEGKERNGYWREKLRLGKRLDPYLIWRDLTVATFVEPSVPTDPDRGDKVWNVLLEGSPEVTNKLGLKFRADVVDPAALVARLDAPDDQVTALELAVPHMVETDPGEGFAVKAAPQKSTGALGGVVLPSVAIFLRKNGGLQGLSNLGIRVLSGAPAKIVQLKELNEDPLTVKAQAGPGKPLVCVIDDRCNFASRAFGKRIETILNQNTDRKTRRIVRTSPGQGKQTETSDGRQRRVWDPEAAERKHESELYRDDRHLYPPPHWSHGSAVLDLLAGNDLRLANFGPHLVRKELGRQRWKQSPPPRVFFVQLPVATVLDTSGGSLSAVVLEGILAAMDAAGQGQAVIVNLSYGSHSGPHDGSSMFERALHELLNHFDGSAKAEKKTLYVVVPAGNFHLLRCHAAHSLAPGKEVKFRWKVLPDDPTDNFVEFWFDKGDEVEISVKPPFGAASPNVAPGDAVSWKVNSKVAAAIVFPRQVAQSTARQMALIAVSPTREGGYVEEVAATESDPPMGIAPHGVWTVTVCNTKRSRHESADCASIHAWVQRGDFAPGRGREGTGYLGRQSYFVDDGSLLVDPMFTLNGIATKRHSRFFAVGAMRQSDHTASRYSGAGPRRDILPPNSAPDPCCGARILGPDLITIADESINLPGLLLRGVSAGSRVRVSGSSVAAPLVARLLYEHLAAGKTVESFLPTWGEDGPGHVDKQAEGQPECADPIYRGQLVRLIPTSSLGGLIDAKPLPSSQQQVPRPAQQPIPDDDREPGDVSPRLPAAL